MDNVDVNVVRQRSAKSDNQKYVMTLVRIQSTFQDILFQTYVG